MKSRLLVATLLVSTGLCAESCATADDTPADAAGVDPPIPGPTGDATVDGDCRSDASPCSAVGLTCERADFCPVAPPISSSYVLTALWGTSGNDVWAAGSGGTILHWAGASWDNVPSGTYATLRAVGGSGPNDIWFVNSRAATFHGLGLENGAMKWAPTPPAIMPYSESGQLIHAVWSGTPDDVWLAGEVLGDSTSGIYANQWRATLTGTTVIAWKPELRIAPDVAFLNQPTIFGITAVGDDQRWAVGGNSHRTPNGELTDRVDGRAYRFRRSTSLDGGAPVREELDTQANDILRSVWGTPAAGVWAVGDRGTIRHYANGAVRWDVVPSPTTEDLLSVWGTGANDVWAVGTARTILHWNGTTWAAATIAVGPRANAGLHAIWGSGPDDVWVAGDNTLLHFTGRKSIVEGGMP